MRYYVIILLLLINLPVYSQGADQIISCHMQNASFDEFAEWVENESGIKIFYNTEWVKDINVTLDADRISVMKALIKRIAGDQFEGI